MAPHFPTRKSNSKSNNKSKDLPLRPRLGVAKEARTKKRTPTLLKQVSKLAKSSAKTSSFGPRSFQRGLVRANSASNLQRVIIKSRIVKHKGPQSRSLAKHVIYLQRDGVGLDGGEPTAFNLYSDLTEGETARIVKEWSEDRHHFRFIVSPERGQDLDLKEYARELVGGLERDLRTKLQWLAVTHHNTDNPHIHLLVRGKDDAGFDLVMSRDYLSHGMRIAAQELATNELGFRHKKDIEQELQNTLGKAHCCAIDYAIKEDLEKSKLGVIEVTSLPQKSGDWEAKQHQYKLQRLKVLQQFGLAEKVAPNIWKVDSSFIQKLRELSSKNDIIKTLHRKIRGIDLDLELSVFDRNNPQRTSISGEVIHKGLVDELHDQNYIIISDTEGRSHHISLAGRTRFRNGECEVGDKVSVTLESQSASVKSDQTILKLAVQNGGVYDLERHLEITKTNRRLPKHISPTDYIDNFRKRINTLERKGFIERVGEGRWQVPDDLITQLKLSSTNTLVVETRSRGKGLDR